MSRKNFDKFMTDFCQGFGRGIIWEWGSGWVSEVLLVFTFCNLVLLPIAFFKKSLFSLFPFYFLSFFIIYTTNALLYSSNL